MFKFEFQLKAARIGLAACLLGLVGCDLNIPDLNDPGIDDLRKNPTPSRIGQAAVGLLIGARTPVDGEVGYVDILGIFGREAYCFDTADPRYITELLEAADLNPGNGAFGGNFWSVPYRNIRNANLLLEAVDIVAGLSDEEKEATRGFAKTIQALDYLLVINTRDVKGAVIQRSSDLHALDPIENKDKVFAYIQMLLDDAKTHLKNGGKAFPFALSSGFAGFDTPDTFLQANRAIKARVDVYTKNYPAAVKDLEESFITADPMMPQLDLGIFHVYGTGSGDQTNGLLNPNILAHPSVKAGAEMKMDGMPDDRVAQKLKMVKMRKVRDLVSDQGFTMYGDPLAHVPIIRNEELILLRAEARMNTGDLMGAIEDINFIRTNSGGLEPRMDLNADNFVDELLKQRVYSLLFEGGHRWLDARRFGRVKMLPLDKPDHHIHEYMPIPKEEDDARQ